MVRNGVRTHGVGAPETGGRFTGSRSVVIGAAVAGVLALGACSAEPELTAATSPPSSVPPATTSASPTASPSPTSTLRTEEAQAVRDATAAVMAYRQVIVDLYSGARTRINDLDEVTTGGFHHETVNGVAQSLARGWKTTPLGVELTLVSADPVKINLDKSPPTVVLRMCIDATQGTDHGPDGATSPGVREVLDYTVTYETHRAVPVWAVARAQAHGDPDERAC